MCVLELIDLDWFMYVYIYIYMLPWRDWKDLHWTSALRKNVYPVTENSLQSSTPQQHIMLGALLPSPSKTHCSYSFTLGKSNYSTILLLISYHVPLYNSNDFLGMDVFSGTSIMHASPTSEYIFDLVQAVVPVVRCYTQLADMIDLYAQCSMRIIAVSWHNCP